MPHFRTIEEFVQLLEQRRFTANETAGECKAKGDEATCAMNLGLGIAYGYTLDILRTSNLGIVIRPEDMTVKSVPMAHRQQGSGFWECDACASKPGSPELCRGCLHNRKVIEDWD